MSYDPRNEFYIPGTFDPTETWPENELTLHQGGLDQIAPAYDPNTILEGAIGYDPFDAVIPSDQTQLDVEPKSLPQWGPPFIKFVDDRMTELEKRVIKELEKWQFQSRTPAGLLDVGGNELRVYAPPPGFTMALHRLVILADGSNAGTPFTAAGGYWELRVGNEAISFGSFVAAQGSLPVEKTWGTRDAPRIRDGEVATLFMSAGPASKRITVKGQGTLDRTIEG
jgi:hypothetical protein